MSMMVNLTLCLADWFARVHTVGVRSVGRAQISSAGLFLDTLGQHGPLRVLDMDG
jgi:hypothetical protein